MPNPLFSVTAAARLDITPGSSSRAFYFSLVAQYQFGVPIIPLGVISPQTLAFNGGIPLYSQVGDPGVQATVPGVVVASSSVVIGGVAYPVSTGAGGGTLYGVNWVDQNGTLHPDVDWAWAISVEPYLNGNASAPPLGTFDVRVVQYTGDGTANRAISSVQGALPALDLTKGVVAIWICGGAASVQDENCFRANHAAMTGTQIIGAGVNSADPSHGIMSFTATGFTVTDGSVAGFHFANKLNTLYTAVVLRDTTSDNRYLRTGRYTGTGSAKTVTALGKVTPLTHLWVWGRGTVYRSSEMAGDAAVTLAVEGQPTTGKITALGALTPSFTIGTDNNVNSNGAPYDYMALSADAYLLSQHVFASVTGVGGAAPPLALPIPFSIDIAFGRQFTGNSTGGVWRGQDHTGTDSDFCANYGNPNLPTTGITSIAGNVLSVGVEIAPNGVTAYGWAFKGGSATVPATPNFIKQPVGPYVPPAGPPGVPLPTPPPSGGFGCSSTIAPGAGNLGTPGCDQDLPVAADDSGSLGGLT